MKSYLYPQNLKATANLWLWSMRDFAILIIAALISAVILVNAHWIVPVVIVLIYGFMTIRLDDTTVLDFIRYAVKFFITTQQHFEWRDRMPHRNMEATI